MSKKQLRRRAYLLYRLRKQGIRCLTRCRTIFYPYGEDPKSMSSLKYPPDMKPGDIATLKVPYKGYRRIELLERLQYTWLVRICESGKEIEVYEDEFETD